MTTENPGMVSEEEKKSSGARELQLVQEIDEFQIFRTPTSFVLRLPGNRFGGYFTTLGGVFRQMVKSSLHDKLIKRSAAEKKDMQSFCKFVSDHDEYIEKLAQKFDNITIEAK